MKRNSVLQSNKTENLKTKPENQNKTNEFIFYFILIIAVSTIIFIFTFLIDLLSKAKITTFNIVSMACSILLFCFLFFKYLKNIAFFILIILPVFLLLLSANSKPLLSFILFIVYIFLMIVFIKRKSLFISRKSL